MKSGYVMDNNESQPFFKDLREHIMANYRGSFVPRGMERGVHHDAKTVNGVGAGLCV